MITTLFGYEHSVYSWIARFALREKGVDFEWVEIDPFADDVPESYFSIHPFGKVPALQVGDLVFYEINVITRFIDEAFDGPILQPVEPVGRARVNQVISIVDSYVYWPLVRQVFSHGYFRPLFGDKADDLEIQEGLKAARRVLPALEQRAGRDGFLVGSTVTLADIHLFPMIDYFVRTNAGMNLLREHEQLTDWWTSMSPRPAVVETRPEILQ